MSLRTPFSSAHRHLVSPLRLAALGVVATLALAGCGGGDDDQSAGNSTDSTTTQSPETSDSTTPSGTTTPDGTDGTSSPGSTAGESTVKPPPTTPSESTEPSGKPAKGDQVSVLDTLPGSGKGGCVRVRSDMTVRSGDLAMGDFQHARQQFAQNQTQNNSLYFFVIPQHAGTMKGATVKASKPGAAPKTFRSDSASSADQWKYYAINLSLTAPGTWTFQVQAGQDRGCFVADF